MKNTINKYFEVKVKLQKTMEDGQQKKVSEQYVVEAATFGEAERRIAECLKPYIEGEFEVTDIKIAGYVQIINTNQDADKFFKSKKMEEIVMSINSTEEGGKGLADEYIKRFAEQSAKNAEVWNG